MKLFKIMTRTFAAVATTALLVTPIASADHGRRGDHYRGHNNHNGHHARHHDRRHRAHNRHRRAHRADRRHYRAHRRHHRAHRRYHHARRHYGYPHHRYSSYPHYNYGGSSVTFSYSTGPSYYQPRYVSPYHVGGHYRYHQHTRYIRDYGRYGLYDPPRGYHWVHDHDRGDAILASAATGAIIGLVIGAIAYD